MNDKETNEWLYYAHRDLENAKDLYHLNKPYNLELICFESQQSIEKLKALKVGYEISSN